MSLVLGYSSESDGNEDNDNERNDKEYNNSLVKEYNNDDNEENERNSDNQLMDNKHNQLKIKSNELVNQLNNNQKPDNLVIQLTINDYEIHEKSHQLPQVRTLGGTISRVYYNPGELKSRNTLLELKRRAKELKRRRKDNGEYETREDYREDNNSDKVNSDREDKGDNSDKENSDREDKGDKSDREYSDRDGSGEYNDRDIDENLHENDPTHDVSPIFSEFVGKSDPPSHPPSQPPKQCFVPKKVVFHTTAHTKGVTKVAFVPLLGHLLLTCGNDSTIKLWDTRTNELLRIFHVEKPVKDVVFSSDGSKFLSCDFDCAVHVWEITGKLVRSYTVPAIPTCLLFHPNDKEFLVGLSNHKIAHYLVEHSQDTDPLLNHTNDFHIHNRSIDPEEPLQVYDHHLGSINALVSLGPKRFLLTAADKSIRIWDYQVNIPIKCISDPTQHSMPSAAVHPLGSHVALLAMDNAIHVVQADGKYRVNRRKVFRGVSVSGHGIQVAFSPDGKILGSGDGGGLAVFWDWKTGRSMARIKVASRVVNCIAFHPCAVSKVAVADSQGELYMLE